jgi:hypothetical protein
MRPADLRAPPRASLHCRPPAGTPAPQRHASRSSRRAPHPSSDPVGSEDFTPWRSHRCAADPRIRMVARASRSPSTLASAARPMVPRSELTELGPLASPESVRGTLAKPPGCSDERLRLRETCRRPSGACDCSPPGGAPRCRRLAQRGVDAEVSADCGQGDRSLPGPGVAGTVRARLPSPGPARYLAPSTAPRQCSLPGAGSPCDYRHRWHQLIHDGVPHTRAGRRSPLRSGLKTISAGRTGEPRSGAGRACVIDPHQARRRR